MKTWVGPSLIEMPDTVHFMPDDLDPARRVADEGTVVDELLERADEDFMEEEEELGEAWDEPWEDDVFADIIDEEFQESDELEEDDSTSECPCWNNPMDVGIEGTTWTPDLRHFEHPWRLPLQPPLESVPVTPTLPLGPSFSPWNEDLTEDKSGCYPPSEEICWRPPKKIGCRGFYVAYPPNEQKLATDLLAVLRACGLPCNLSPRPNDRCGNVRCCRNPKGTLIIRRVELDPNANIPASMARIAHMIRGTIAKKSSFCIELTSTIRQIDRYANPGSTSESTFNPTFLAGIRPTQFKGYTRTKCDLLAHVIAENFWGRNCYSKRYLRYKDAHVRALIEESWIRQNEVPKRKKMTWEGMAGLPSAADTKAGLKAFDKQLKGAEARKKARDKAKAAKEKRKKKVF